MNVESTTPNRINDTDRSCVHLGIATIQYMVGCYYSDISEAVLYTFRKTCDIKFPN